MTCSSYMEPLHSRALQGRWKLFQKIIRNRIHNLLANSQPPLMEMHNYALKIIAHPAIYVMALWNSEKFIKLFFEVSRFVQQKRWNDAGQMILRKILILFRVLVQWFVKLAMFLCHTKSKCFISIKNSQSINFEVLLSLLINT